MRQKFTASFDVGPNRERLPKWVPWFWGSLYLGTGLFLLAAFVVAVVRANT